MAWPGTTDPWHRYFGEIQVTGKCVLYRRAASAFAPNESSYRPVTAQRSSSTFTSARHFSEVRHSGEGSPATSPRVYTEGERGAPSAGDQPDLKHGIPNNVALLYKQPGRTTVITKGCSRAKGPLRHPHRVASIAPKPDSYEFWKILSGNTRCFPLVCPRTTFY